MSDHSKIEWTDATWNPVRGCTKISPGCAHCYASAFAERFRGVPNHPYERGFDLRLVPEKLCEPIGWTKPKMVFVNSMADLFHPEVPTSYIVDVAKVMKRTDWHIYQVLTKRSERMRDLLNNELKFVSDSPHIWWGVSVEDKRFGLPRVDHLRETAGQVRFLSVEPLLEHLGEFDMSNIDWVIVGGESGRGARPLMEDWVQSILRLCEESNVPFFFKQWGGVHKKVKGRLLNEQTYDSIPPIIRSPIPDRTQRLEVADEFQSSVAQWVAMNENTSLHQIQTGA